jgi:exosome complex exonuclease DIS3/RRP44
VTRKGNVVKIVKEHYLRDDIYCGLPCSVCLQTEHPLLLEPVLIPDTNVFMHQVRMLSYLDQCTGASSNQECSCAADSLG